MKSIGKAIASFFSAKIGGYSGPGFRTPPIFPGSTPSTISVSSGGNINARTPPFVNGFQQPSLNSQGVLGGPYTIYDSVNIRAHLSLFEKLVWEMKRRARGIKGLIKFLIVAPWQAGLAIGSGGAPLLAASIGEAALIYKQMHEQAHEETGGAMLTTDPSGTKRLVELTPTEIVKPNTDFQNLVSDIKANGIRESIKLVEHHGVYYIVDGNHRYTAAHILNLKEVPIEQVSLPYKGFKTSLDLQGVPMSRFSRSLNRIRMKMR